MLPDLPCLGLIAREGPVRILPSSGVLAALLSCVGLSHASPSVDALVVTVDGRHYITYESIAISPVERLVQAPDLRMSRCERSDGQQMAEGPFRLIYSASGAFLDAVAMRIRFNPTRVELDTLGGNVVCGGEAMGHESGVDRIFRDHFEVD
jgi:hypothetical protein